MTEENLSRRRNELEALLEGVDTGDAKDQKDIFQYLNGELAKKTDEIVALEERVLKLEEEHDQSVREHEAWLLSQKDAAELEIGKLHKQLGEFKEQLQEVRRPLWLPQPRPS